MRQIPEVVDGLSDIAEGRGLVLNGLIHSFFLSPLQALAANMLCDSQVKVCRT